MPLKIYMRKKKIINNIDAINEALHFSMQKDKKVITYGLGATDPGKIFQTNKNLLSKFGPSRIFDTPTSENSLVGMGIGASLLGIRSIISSQRIDFITLAMDQIINGAAKWHYMTGGKIKVPIVLRLIVGRGWGQGATHSQNFHSLFSSVPGLKIVMPTFPNDTRSILIESIFDNNPVIFIEQRWIHNFRQNKLPYKKIKIGKSLVKKKGNDLTIVGMSYSTIQALKVSDILSKLGYNVEVIDLISIIPLDKNTILNSVKKTKRLLVLEIGSGFSSLGSEIISIVTNELFSDLHAKPIKMSFPDIPNISSSFVSAKLYYNEYDILKTIKKNFFKKLKINNEIKKKTNSYPDIPGKYFQGPF
mgnify:CR=1 FL=1